MNVATASEIAAPDEDKTVRLRALVVSDIHAVPDSKPTRASWADMSDPTNPISTLADW